MRPTRNESIFTFSILLLLAVVDIGSCLQCYECGLYMKSKFEIEVCKDPFTKMASVKECGPAEVCVKHQKAAQPYISQDMTIRGCTFASYCSTQEDDYEYCKTCTHDLCNSGTIIVPAFGLIVILGVVKRFV